MPPRNARLYGLSTCVQCKSVRNFLLDQKIPFEMIEVDRLDDPERRIAMDAMRKHNPKGSFPTLLIGDTVVVGYQRRELREAAAAFHRNPAPPDKGSTP